MWSWIRNVHFHNWIYGDRIRMCKKCGKKQHYQIWMDGSTWADEPNACETCEGTGKWLFPDFSVGECPTCLGKGK